MDPDLFSDAVDSGASEAHKPLAERLRPASCDEVVGQEHLAGEKGPIRLQVERGHLANMILVGPPGVGKTTIARIVGNLTGMEVVEKSAVSASVAEIRKLGDEARQTLGATGTRTILFLDEIHRFNKAQQDTLLPLVESGILTLIGATTENPYVSLNRALLSRTVTYELRPLQSQSIERLLGSAAEALDTRLGDGALELVQERCGGDARTALSLLEVADMVAASPGLVTSDDVRAASSRRAIDHDRAGSRHYDTISAFIKSMRIGNATQAIKYLAEMLEGGTDPMFIARRMVIFASEDVGNALNGGLMLATSAMVATEKTGMPECRIVLSQVTRYLAEAPKSRTAIDDIDSAIAEVRSFGVSDVPLELTNHKTTTRYGSRS